MDQRRVYPWARFNLSTWLEVSDTFRRLQPADRRLAVALYLWNSARGPIPNVTLDIARAAMEEDTSNVDRIRSLMPTFGFELVDGAWENDKSMEVYREALSLSGVRSAVGRRRGKKPSEAIAEANAEQLLKQKPSNCSAIVSLSLSPTLPDSSERIPIQESISVSETYSNQGDGGESENVPRKDDGEQLSLAVVKEPVDVEAEVVDLPRVPPPQRTKQVDALARTYLLARSLRLWGDETRRSPSRAMVAEIAEKLDPLLRAGFDWQLLVSLPALVNDQAIDFMLRSDATILLRMDNPQGGKTHARKFESQLPDLVLGDRQVAILRNIGTLQYVQACGAKASAWDATEVRK